MKTKKLTMTAMLTAAALIVFIIEAQLPPLTPVPGIKLGLSNIIVLVAMYSLGIPSAAAVLALRIILGNIFTGSGVSFLYGASGGVCCFLIMLLFFKLLNRNQLWAVSVFGAIAHNCGQLAAALFITGTSAMLWYTPVLIISAILTGALTGITAQLVLKHFPTKKKE